MDLAYQVKDVQKDFLNHYQKQLMLHLIHIIILIKEPEPIGVFDLEEHDAYHQHIIARRIFSLEIIVLLLGYKLCHSSIAVEYLSSASPFSRSKLIKLIHM